MKKDKVPQPKRKSKEKVVKAWAIEDQESWGGIAEVSDGYVHGPKCSCGDSSGPFLAITLQKPEERTHSFPVTIHIKKS